MSNIRLLIIFSLILTSCASTDVTGFRDLEYSNSIYDKPVIDIRIDNLQHKLQIEKIFVAELASYGIDAIHGSTIFPPTRQFTNEEWVQTFYDSPADSAILISVLGSTTVNPTLKIEVLGKNATAVIWTAESRTVERFLSETPVSRLFKSIAKSISRELIDQNIFVQDKRSAYEQKCKTGNAMSCFTLGAMFDTGEDGPINKLLARTFFELACDGGSAGGCYNFGIMLDNGEGGLVNYERARIYYDQACSGGNLLACQNLGIMLNTDEGGPPDFPKARALFNQGCKDGHADSCNALGMMMADGLDGAQDVFGARALFNETCNNGDATGCWALGTLFDQGAGGPKDHGRAIALYEKACEAGNDQACDLLK